MNDAFAAYMLSTFQSYFEPLPSYMSRSKRLRVPEKQLPDVDLRTIRIGEEYWTPPITPMSWEETMALAYMPFVDMPGLLEALLKVSAYEKAKGLSLTIPLPAFSPQNRLLDTDPPDPVFVAIHRTLHHAILLGGDYTYSRFPRSEEWSHITAL